MVLRDTPGGASGQLLGVDAVRECNVVADTYGAQYGKRPGGSPVDKYQRGRIVATVVNARKFGEWRAVDITRDMVEAFRAHQADIIVSVGGGSPLDTGKLIALKATHERPLVDYDDATGGDAFIGPNVPPIITVPTTVFSASMPCSSMSRAAIAMMSSPSIRAPVSSQRRTRSASPS